MTPLFFVALLFLIPTTLQAQEVADRKFWAVNTLLVSSTIYDVESTYPSLAKGYRELNPRMRLLVKTGRPALYAVQGAVDAGIIYASYKMKGSDNKFFKNTWYVLPVSVATAHFIAGTINIKLAVSF